MLELVSFGRRFLLLLLLAGALPAWADPPSRVGRLSLVEGGVTVRDDAGAEAVQGELNWPIATGMVLETGSGAAAEVQVGSTSLRQAGDGDLEFSRLDERGSQLRLVQGTLEASVRSRRLAAGFALWTPQGRVLLTAPGRYRFDVGPDLTAVTVFQGGARVDTAAGEYRVPAGTRLVFSDPGGVRQEAAPWDAFDAWVQARDARETAAGSDRYVSPEMTGAENLAPYGSWRESPAYGPVWMPAAVPDGWAPYRWGHWAWISPWGWTWVDEQPWGFAPFHYGRWVLLPGGWAWAPGRLVASPVYAPALVAWAEEPGIALSVSWFPLAPHEVFVPAYRCSPAYLRAVNIAHVSNAAAIASGVRFGADGVPRARPERGMHFANLALPRAVTVVPAHAIGVRERMARVMQAPSRPQALVAAQAPARGAAPVMAARPGAAPQAAVHGPAVPGQPGGARRFAESGKPVLPPQHVQAPAPQLHAPDPGRHGPAPATARPAEAAVVTPGRAQQVPQHPALPQGAPVAAAHPAMPPGAAQHAPAPKAAEPRGPVMAHPAVPATVPPAPAERAHQRPREAAVSASVPPAWTRQPVPRAVERPATPRVPETPHAAPVPPREVRAPAEPPHRPMPPPAPAPVAHAAPPPAPAPAAHAPRVEAPHAPAHPAAASPAAPAAHAHPHPEEVRRPQDQEAHQH